MKQLNELKWDALLLSDLFSFDKGNQNNMASLQEGNIPLVSAKKCDNGYKTFIQKNNKRLYSGHCITLNNDGDGGAERNTAQCGARQPALRARRAHKRTLQE